MRPPPAPVSAVRAGLLEDLAGILCARQVGHPLRVGVDGVCGVGKSTFTRELSAAVRRRGRPAVHLDSDGFHHVRAVRHRNVADPARGYYLDAYDFEALRERVLVPLGPGGTRRYACAVHDLRTDAVLDTWSTVPAEAVVLFDATFLQRGALRECWDEVIYLDAPTEIAQQRGVNRDADALGGAAAATATYQSRYMAACLIYLAEERPADRASIVIGHEDPAAPRLLARRHGASDRG